MTIGKSKTTKPEGAKKKRAKASKTPEPEPAITPVEAKAMAVKEDSLFEFYKIFPPDIPRAGFESELCNPSCQRVSKTNLHATLAMICAEAYGEGDFIALEVGGASEGQSQGLPFAYWLIRVKPNKHGIPCRKAEQIALDDEDHEHLNILKRHPALVQASEEDKQREREAGALEGEGGILAKFDRDQGHSYRKDPMLNALRDYKDSDEWRRLFDPDRMQRAVRAGQMAAKYFDWMPNPQAGEGMRPHDYVRLRMSQGAKRDEIISDLTYDKGPFRLSLKKADTTYNSVMRGKQMKAKKEREQQKEQGRAKPPAPSTTKRAKK